jgi:glutathione S-transferase
MKLYNFPWGPYPRRVTLYLAEKGIIDLELVNVEFPHKPERWPPGFLRTLNPAGALPVLDTADGAMIRQSIAILEYLEERYPSPNMIGRTPKARAATRELVSVFDEATSFFGIWARQGSRLNVERHKPSAEAAAVGAERFASKLRLAEEMIGGPFLAGHTATIADIVAMALLEFVQGFYGVPIPSGCSRLAKWFERFSQRRSIPPVAYPAEELRVAHGLPEQTGIAV